MALKMMTLGFANIPTMERTFSMIDTNRTLDVPWYILNNHYPINEKETTLWLSENAKRFKYILLDCGENIGLHNGVNFIVKHCFDTDDHMLALDPDTFPATKGFDSIMYEKAKDPRNVWISMFNNHSFGEMKERGFNEEHDVLIPLAPVINSICMWSINWLLNSGGAIEPHAYYGGIECAMWQKIDQINKRWVFDKFTLELSSSIFENLVDKEYTKYKYDHVFNGYQKSFKEYLIEGKYNG